MTAKSRTFYAHRGTAPTGRRAGGGRGRPCLAGGRRRSPATAPRTTTAMTAADVKKADLLQKGLGGQAQRQGLRTRPTRSRAASTCSSRARARARSGRCSASSRTSRTTASPQPDRTVDNTHDLGAGLQPRLLQQAAVLDTRQATTRWRNFYLEQSSDRYTVDGDATDWVPVPGQRRRTTTTTPDSEPQSGTSSRTRSTAGTTLRSRPARPRRDQRVPEPVRQVYDRYDYDGDGNFNEPDGYIDTFQSVHAGEGEEAGGGALGRRHLEPQLVRLLPAT